MKTHLFRKEATKIINFIGISLGFLIVAITQFKIEDIKSTSYILYYLFSFFIFTGVLFLFLSIVIGFLINYVTIDSENPNVIKSADANRIHQAFLWLFILFFLGLISIVLIIIILAFKSLTILALFSVITIVMLKIIIETIKNPTK